MAAEVPVAWRRNSRADTIRHSVAVVGAEHGTVELDAEERTQFVHDALGLADQIFIRNDNLPFAVDRQKKPADVVIRGCP